jgi:ABC-type lipoprotein export system ATPase subunit
MNRHAIKIKNLLHLYNSSARRFLLEVDDLLIPEGSLTTLLGPSGSGKSTLQSRMGLLLGPGSNEFSSLEEFEIVERTPEGTVCHDVATLLNFGRKGRRDMEDLRRRLMGFYLQSGELIPTLTVKENVAMPLRNNGMSAKAANQRTEELLGFLLGLSVKAIPNKLPMAFSVGQCQRIALARAVAHRPQILFVDEPTSSLDLPNKKRVLDLMSKIVQDEGTTVVMINHDESLAREYSDYIVQIQANPNGWGDRIALPFRECDGFGHPIGFEAKSGGGWKATDAHFEITHTLKAEEKNVA